MSRRTAVVDAVQTKHGEDLHNNVPALINVSFEVHGDDILALIEPNGTGKGSLINCISGFYRPRSWEILFNGRKIAHLRPVQRFRLVISRTFQTRMNGGFFPVFACGCASGSFGTINETIYNAVLSLVLFWRE